MFVFLGQIPLLIYGKFILQIPSLGNFGLIDAETPSEAYTKGSWYDNTEMELVFSDEFNQEGRSFYPGDDPYWEAVDLHYWSTNDMEWLAAFRMFYVLH
jgi:beta-glucan synthesis-associated protein KRE6